MEKPDFELLLSHAFEDAVENHQARWEEVHASFWARLGLDAATLSAKIRSAAVGYVGDASELRTEHGLPTEPFERLQAEVPEGMHEILFLAVMQQAHAALGGQLVAMMAAAETRLYELLVLAGRFPRDLATGAFLKRVGRCYLLGFDVECVVMCRAALDRTFRRKISDGDCRRAFDHPRPSPNQPARNYTLKQRIDAAGKLGVISPEIHVKAVAITRAGNDAVHQWPECRINLLDAIGRTVDVIAAVGGVP